MGKRCSVTLTEVEYNILKKAREYFVGETGVGITLPAFITLVSLGILTHESINGIGITCPKCQYRAEFIRVEQTKGVVKGKTL